MRMPSLVKFLPLLSVVLLIPVMTYAAGLVPCSGTDCTSCDLLVLAQNIIKFVLEMAFLAVVIFIAIGGFMYIFSGGNKSTVDKALGMIKGAVIGLVIMLCSWLIINTVFWLISGGHPGEWWKITC